MAQGRHSAMSALPPLLGDERTCRGHRQSDANDPRWTSRRFLRRAAYHLCVCRLGRPEIVCNAGALDLVDPAGSIGRSRRRLSVLPTEGDKKVIALVFLTDTNDLSLAVDGGLKVSIRINKINHPGACFGPSFSDKFKIGTGTDAVIVTLNPLSRSVELECCFLFSNVSEFIDRGLVRV
jgi:hypothetical protein